MAGVEVVINVERQVARWRPLVQWLLAGPILIVNGALAIALVPATVAAALVTTITGTPASVLTRFQHTALDARVRAYAYFFVLRSTAPPLFRHDPHAGLRAIGERSDIRVSRAEPLVRLLRVAPLGLVLVPLAVVMDALYPVIMLMLFVRGSWPRRLSDAFVVIEDVVVALLAYVGMASDRHPLDRSAADAPLADVIDLTEHEARRTAASKRTVSASQTGR